MSRFSPGVFAAKSARGGRRPALGLAMLVCSLAILAVFVSSAGAGKVPSTQVVLGQTATVPDPSCPGLPCQAVGSVTGFQVSNSQTRSPFLVTQKGTVKSWSLTLAQPTNKQRSFFRRPAWRSCAAFPVPTRPATTCAARARSRSSPPTSARRSNSAPR
jgi:hypothetical protein